MSQFQYLAKKREKAMNVFRQAHKDLLAVRDGYSAEYQLAVKRRNEAEAKMQVENDNIRAIDAEITATQEQANKIAGLLG